MRKLCPSCEKETEVNFIVELESIKVRGTPIEVEAKYYRCLDCKNDFDDPLSDYDPLEKAYEKYRHIENLLQPSAMKMYRKSLGLTQAEMAKLLGWGDVTLARYENSSLQTESHDKFFRLAMIPDNMLILLESNPNALPEEKREYVVKKLNDCSGKISSLRDFFRDKFGNYSADSFSGYKKLDLEKLFNAILFFCENGVNKTKLCKLLFYADFKHFQEYALSITGVRYAHLQYGPVPDEYELYYATLINDEKSLKKQIIYHTEDIFEEKFTSQKEPDLSIFCKSELKILATVKKHFKHYGARDISDFSHKEQGYVETMEGEHISYEYADNLNW